MDKTVRRPSIKVENGKSSRRPDSVSVESALSIAINKSGQTYELGLTMRTPGDDHDLVLGISTFRRSYPIFRVYIVD